MSVASFCVHNVDIETNTPASDGAGNMVASWAVTHAAQKACIQPLSAREIAQQWQGMPTEASHRIYFSDTSITLTEKSRIIFGARTFGVVGVRNIDELDCFLTVDAKENR